MTLKMTGIKTGVNKIYQKSPRRYLFDPFSPKVFR
jgi:hypothetical protein